MEDAKVSTLRKKNQNELRDEIISCIKHIEQIEKITTEDEIGEILSHIEKMLKNFPGPLTIQKLTKIDNDGFEERVEGNYNIFLQLLLKLFDSNFPFKQNKLFETVKNLFEIDDPIVFKVNFDKLVKNLNMLNGKTIAPLLQIVLEAGGLLGYIFSMCNDPMLKSDNQSVKTFATLLISLPNRMANVLQHEIPDFYIPANFSKFLLYKILTISNFIVQFAEHEPTVESRINLEPISILLNKIFLDFNDKLNNASIKIFIEIVAHLTNKNSNLIKVYQRVFQKIFFGLDRSAIDIFGKMLLLNIDPEKYFIKNILGENLVKSETWKFTLCTKIPLLSFFPEDYTKLIINLVVYISSVNSALVMNLYLSLLEVWADKNSVKHTSVEQQLFITKLIIVITNSLKNIGINDFEQQKIKEKVFLGIQVHLECPTEVVRVCGMKLGEIVLNFISKEGEIAQESELKFEYHHFKEDTQIIINDLQSLIELEINKYFLTKTNFDTNIESLLQQLEHQRKEIVSYTTVKHQHRNKINIAEIKNDLEFSELKTKSNIKIIDGTDFELDSDDDLEPYDLSNDTKLTKKSPPVYLRDLRDGLLETEDAEIFILSLQNCQNLVVSQLADDDASIGLELLEILIALEQRFYVEKFDENLFESCVCITCVYPAYYAEYLCKQIHADVGTYSIARRIFMLDVLKQAARNLSAIKKQVVENKSVDQSKINSAEEVIRKRLEAKTRYFKKHKPQVSESVNHFASVATHFFFPLLYGYNTNKILLDEKEFILLIHFIETLAVIMCATQNCPVASKFAKEAFQFSWFLRFHVDVNVRMAVLSLIASSVLVVPKEILINDFLNELFELRLWLADLLSPNVAKGEPNYECRELAINVMVLIESILKMDLDN